MPFFFSFFFFSLFFFFAFSLVPKLACAWPTASVGVFRGIGAVAHARFIHNRVTGREELSQVHLHTGSYIEPCFCPPEPEHNTQNYQFSLHVDNRPLKQSACVRNSLIHRGNALWLPPMAKNKKNRPVCIHVSTSCMQILFDRKSARDAHSAPSNWCIKVQRLPCIWQRHVCAPVDKHHISYSARPKTTGRYFRVE
jgi:hypothetical protein